MSTTHTFTAEEQFCLQGCRSYEQYHTMRSRFEQSTCVFCPVNRSINKILSGSNDLWLVWENPFPRKSLEIQIMVVPIRHVRKPAELRTDEWAAFGSALRWIEGAFDVSGGMLFARFGDMRYNAGTVPHLHFNYWVPTGDREERIPIVKSLDGTEANRKRAASFAEHYESGEIPVL